MIYDLVKPSLSDPNASYLLKLVEQLQYSMNQMQEQLERMKQQIETLEGKANGIRL